MAKRSSLYAKLAGRVRLFGPSFIEGIMTMKLKLRIAGLWFTTAAVTFAGGYYIGVIQMAGYVREIIGR